MDVDLTQGKDPQAGRKTKEDTKPLKISFH